MRAARLPSRKVTRIVQHVRQHRPSANPDDLFGWSPVGLLTAVYLPTGETVSLGEMRAVLDRLERRVA